MSERITTECPPGYYAKASGLRCQGCAFFTGPDFNNEQCKQVKCCKSERDDYKNVIFIKEDAK